MVLAHCEGSQISAPNQIVGWDAEWQSPNGANFASAEWASAELASER